jgi:hypothetical protein
MSSIGDAFLPPDPASLGVPALSTLQTSLFNRLRKTYGNRSGAMSWLLVRLAQPSHRDHMAALTAIEAQPTATLSALSLVVAAARAALVARVPGVGPIADQIIETLRIASTGAPGEK